MSSIVATLEQHDFVIIGHRGAAGLSPENTLPSFAKALTLGCPMIELDVHRVFDQDQRQRLLVIHDQKLDRTTNGRGRIEDFGLPDLRALDAGDGQQIPVLEEVVALLQAQRDDTGICVALNIELKGQATAEPVAEFLQAMQGWPVLVSSFNHAELSQFRSLDTTTAVAPLYDRYAKDWATTAARLDAVAVNISGRIVSPARIQAMRDAGYMVFVYTINELKIAQKLKEIGASGVFTDRPDLLIGQGLG